AHVASANVGSANAFARSPALSCARHVPVRSIDARASDMRSGYGEAVCRVRTVRRTLADESFHVPTRERERMSRPATLGELRARGWVSRPVKEEVRANAVAALAAGRPLVDGVIGYESTVLPQLANALLAGHDVIFLGERGQAKTRIIRSLTNLLDEWMPIVAGSEINDDPYNPVSSHARHLVAARGD